MNIEIAESELEIMPIRAQGAGGQNVNKVSSAIHLRFDIRNSRLPESCKEQLLRHSDHRISKDGVVVIKAQQYRTQEKNREDAIQRLVHLIRSVVIQKKKRQPTKPTRAARQRRVEGKVHRSKTKALRGKVKDKE